MNLYGNLADEAAMAGMLYGMNPKTIVSIPASEKINFGKAVFLNAEKTALVGGKYNNKAVIDLSIYTTVGKNIVLTIKGVDIESTTSGTIDVAAIIKDINEIEGVTAVVGVAETEVNTGKITVTSDDSADLGVKLVCDDSDVTSSKVTPSSDCVYAGIAVFQQNAFINSRGCYVAKEAVNVMEKGYVWGALASGVNPTVEASAYVTTAGLFTTESSGNTLVGKFKSGAKNGSNSDSLALVSIE